MSNLKFYFVLMFSLLALGCNDTTPAKEEIKTEGETSVNIRAKKLGNILFIPEYQDIEPFSKSSLNKNILILSSVLKHIDVRLQGEGTDTQFMNIEPINYSSVKGIAIQVGDSDHYCLTAYDSNSKLPLAEKLGATCSFTKLKTDELSKLRVNKVDMMYFVQDPSKSTNFTRIFKSNEFQDGEVSLLIQNTRNLPVAYEARCENGTTRGRVISGTVPSSYDLRSVNLTCPVGEELISLVVGEEAILEKDLPTENGFIIIN